MERKRVSRANDATNVNMTGMTDLVEQLLWHDESTTLDFKQAQYPLTTPEEKGELIKDILAYANTSRDKDAHIIIGAKERRGHRATVIGITEHLDDAHLQQLISAKTNRPVTFTYRTTSIDGRQLGIIQIPVQERFFYLKNDFGKVRANIVYRRQGSSTCIANPDEIKRMVIEDYPAANGSEIKALDLLHDNARFGDRGWQLIETLCHLSTETSSLPQIASMSIAADSGRSAPPSTAHSSAP